MHHLFPTECVCSVKQQAGNLVYIYIYIAGMHFYICMCTKVMISSSSSWLLFTLSSIKNTFDFHNFSECKHCFIAINSS